MQISLLWDTLVCVHACVQLCLCFVHVLGLILSVQWKNKIINVVNLKAFNVSLYSHLYKFKCWTYK